MASFKATSLFLLGTLAGLGVACVVVAHLLDGGGLLQQLGPVKIFLAGVLLVAIGLLDGLAVTRGERTRRLRSVLGTIAILAILLGVVVEVRRRAERFKGLEAQHDEQAKRLYNQLDDIAIVRPDAPGRQARLRLAHWHDAMSIRFRGAAFRPWLPLPTFVPCVCRECAAPGGLRSDGN